MLDRHEPDEKFVDNLEWQIAGDMRRRNRDAVVAHPKWRLVRVAVLVLVSMSLGAAAMGATYQIEESWRRDLLVAGLEVRIELARQWLDAAGEEIARTERQVSAGALSEETLKRAQIEREDAGTRLERMRLDLEEVRISGREPRNDVSAPLIGGRDFVSERLLLEIELMDRHLEVVAGEMQRVDRQADVGLATDTSAAYMQAEVAGIRAGRNELAGRLTYRQGVLEGRITPVEAELYLLRDEAERREEAVRARLMPVVGQLEEIRARVAAGLETELMLLQAELQVAEMEAELRLAEQEQEIIARELRARVPAQD